MSGKKEDEDEGGSIQTGLYNTLSDVVKKPSMISTIGSDRPVSSTKLRHITEQWGILRAWRRIKVGRVTSSCYYKKHLKNTRIGVHASL